MTAKSKTKKIIITKQFLTMQEELLDALLGITHISVIQPLKVTYDNNTFYPNPVRRMYGGYKRLVAPEVTICDSLIIHDGQKEYEEMIEDMTRMSLARTRGLMVEKRASRYERKQKSK